MKQRIEQLARKAAEILKKEFFVAEPLNGGGWYVRFDNNSYESRIFPTHTDSDENITAQIIKNIKKCP